MSDICVYRSWFVCNKAKRPISKRRWQASKTRQIFRKQTFFTSWCGDVRVRIRGQEMFVFRKIYVLSFLSCAYQRVKIGLFRKIWRALLSCYLRFEIRPFALLPMDYPGCTHQVWYQLKKNKLWVFNFVSKEINVLQNFMIFYTG